MTFFEQGTEIVALAPDEVACNGDMGRVVLVVPEHFARLTGRNAFKAVGQLGSVAREHRNTPGEMLAPHQQGIGDISYIRIGMTPAMFGKLMHLLTELLCAARG